MVEEKVTGGKMRMEINKKNSRGRKEVDRKGKMERKKGEEGRRKL